MSKATKPEVKSTDEKENVVVNNDAVGSEAKETPPDEVIPVNKKETEKEFLQRVLQIQHEGGFGRHLDHVIYERINTLK